jgi:hypothetical protein
MDELDEQILALNGLNYPQSEELSLANAHRLRSFPALRDAYSAGTSAYVDISCGSDMIAPRASWLEFDIFIEGANATLPTNGGMAIFRETIVRARSGQELDRYQFANIHNNGAMPVECQYGTQQTVATAMQGGAAIVDGQTVSVAIPLQWVNPFFSSSRLIPSSLGTIRLEMLFAPAVEALIGVGATYQVRNLNVVVDTFSLSDAALRSLQMIASQSGLAYEWQSLATTVSTANGTSGNFISLKSASRALQGTLHICETARLTDAASNSLFNEPFEVTQSQWSLGSQYLPTKPLSTAPSHYLNLLYSFDSLQHCREFSPQLDLEGFIARYGMLACNLERSSVLQNNGQSTSSSRPLIVTCNFENPKNRTTFLFLRYSRVALIFSDGNTVLKE